MKCESFLCLWSDLVWSVKMEGGGSTGTSEVYQYVGPFRLEKTLGKGQTGKYLLFCVLRFRTYLKRKKGNGTLSVHSVKTPFIRNAWRYQVEININQVGVQYFKTLTKQAFKLTQLKIRRHVHQYMSMHLGSF